MNISHASGLIEFLYYISFPLFTVIGTILLNEKLKAQFIRIYLDACLLIFLCIWLKMVGFFTPTFNQGRVVKPFASIFILFLVIYFIVKIIKIEINHTKKQS